MLNEQCSMLNTKTELLGMLCFDFSLIHRQANLSPASLCGLLIAH
jgi:hypothetical protein